jgi:hypothetical protein
MLALNSSLLLELTDNKRRKQMRANYHLNERGMALPLTLIFVAAFSALGLGILSMSIDEMKLVSNFEHGLRAFYYAEGALNEAVAGFQQTGTIGRYQYRPAIAAGQVAAVAQMTQEQGVYTILATGRSGDVTKHVELKLQLQNDATVLSQWKDYGIDTDHAPKL